MFLFCLEPWPYLLNIQPFSSEWLDVFSIAAQVFSNLFLKICPLFGQILITCSRASFSLSSYSEKMRWGRGCIWRLLWGIMLLTGSQRTNISFSCYARSESRKWTGISRFEIRNIFLFHFGAAIFWRFRWFACVDGSQKMIPWRNFA